MKSTCVQFKTSAFCVIAAACLFSCLSGCSGRSDQGAADQRTGTQGRADAASGTGPVKETKDYKLTGEVKSVDKEVREVTIRHDAIPGFMGAMTMPFELEDRAVLDELRPGDQVEGKLRVDQENGVTKDYKLLDLTVTKPAPANAMVLDLSGGVPQLRPKPKRLEVGEEVPDFTMTGQDGKEFKLSSLRGKVVVLTFIYTRCPLPDFCPLMDRKFSELAQSIGVFPNRAKNIRLISLSFDPEHDTPDILRKHAQIRGATPPLWSYAVAAHEELGRVMVPLGLIYGPGKNEIAHNLCTAIIDPAGKLARLEVGTQSNKWTTADFLKSIYSLLPTTSG